MALSKITNGGVAASGMPSGSVIQIQRTQFTGTNEISITAGADTVFTDLTVNITPSSTSSIIKIDAQVTGEWANQGAATDGVWFFFRDTTKLSHAAAGSRNVGIMTASFLSFGSSNASSTPENVYYSYFDSPNSTSQITYKVGANEPAGGYNYFLNRTVSDLDGYSYERGISFITVTEIAG